VKGQRKSQASDLDILDEAINELAKSAGSADVNEDILDEDFDEELADAEYDEDLDEDEDWDDEDEDDEDLGVSGRRLSNQWNEDELTATFDDLDDTATTRGSKKLDASFGGPNMPGKIMTPAQYTRWYKKWTAKKNIVPDNPSVAKSMTTDFEEEAIDALDVSPFLRSITKSLGGHVDSLAEVVTDNLGQQNEFNSKLAKAVAAQGRIIQNLVTGGNRRAVSNPYQILNKGGSQTPNRQVVLNALEKSFQAGQIDQSVIANFETNGGQITPDIESVLASQGLINF